MTILSPFIEEILKNAENLFVYPGNCEIGRAKMPHLQNKNKGEVRKISFFIRKYYFIPYKSLFTKFIHKHCHVPPKMPIYA